MSRYLLDDDGCWRPRRPGTTEQVLRVVVVTFLLAVLFCIAFGGK